MKKEDKNNKQNYLKSRLRLKPKKKLVADYH